MSRYRSARSALVNTASTESCGRQSVVIQIFFIAQPE
jgi:hypothetical protein